MPVDRHRGTCRLCGQEAEMTFEHIPPQSARNKARRRAADLVAAHNEANPGAFPARGWTQLQRGVGAAVLCEPCNNDTGAKLVPPYSELANTITDELSARISVKDGLLHIPLELELQLEGWRLGAVAREALVMLMASSGGAAVTRRWPSLKALINRRRRATATRPGARCQSVRRKPKPDLAASRGDQRGGLQGVHRGSSRPVRMELNDR